MVKEKPRAYYDLLKLSSLGLEMGAAVVIGLLMGSWLDGHFDTQPWLTFLFLGCGLAAAGKAVYRAIRKGIFEDDFEETDKEINGETKEKIGQEVGEQTRQDHDHGQ